MLSEKTLVLIRLAVEEDLGAGDLTCLATIETSASSEAIIFAKEEIVVCGHEVAKQVFLTVDSELKYKEVISDGKIASKNQIFATVSGSTRSILSAERTTLNFLQRMSGVATKTRSLMNSISSSKVKLLDTRKTIPGFRELDKYAVKTGGGHNHRMGLFDVFLIKNNHIDANNGDILKTIRSCRAMNPNFRLEVEVRSLLELSQALEGAPDVILLDNMTTEQIVEAIAVVKKHINGKTIKIEASGGITEENLLSYASTGVDFISMGALTHSVKAVDISLHYGKIYDDKNI